MMVGDVTSLQDILSHPQILIVSFWLE